MKSILFLIILVIFGLPLSYVWTSNFANAQLALYHQQLPVLQSVKATIPTATAVKLNTVKILSPAKGQQVQMGKDLTVSGIATTTTTSAANKTPPCQVFVIVNSIKPYHPAKGIGPGGPADYSKWNFVLTSKYTTIKPGPSNKITAKYLCSNNPKASFYSVNVTGVSNPPTPAAIASTTHHTPTTIASPGTGVTGIASQLNQAQRTSNGTLIINDNSTTSNGTLIGNGINAHNTGFINSGGSQSGLGTSFSHHSSSIHHISSAHPRPHHTSTASIISDNGGGGGSGGGTSTSHHRPHHTHTHTHTASSKDNGGGGGSGSKDNGGGGGKNHSGGGSKDNGGGGGGGKDHSGGGGGDHGSSGGGK